MKKFTFFVETTNFGKETPSQAPTNESKVLKEQDVMNEELGLQTKGQNKEVAQVLDDEEDDEWDIVDSI